MKLTRANDGKHKWIAEFKDGHKTSFGAVGYDDYTIKHDADQRDRYLRRHQATENWNNPKSAGALSRWILWNQPTIAGSLRSFHQRFGNI